MMSRQLTALEKYRITGVSSAHEQFAEFERLGIPANIRVSAGAHIIECIATKEKVCACLGESRWAEICDENVNAGVRLSPQFRSTLYSSSQDIDDSFASSG